ncbi:hypothetical protein QTP88_029350 [Uroleucon formosanum]
MTLIWFNYACGSLSVLQYTNCLFNYIATPSSTCSRILLLTTVQGQLPYTVEEFKNQTLMYCENSGSIRVTGASWEILTYVPLKNYDKLYNELDTMTNHCKETSTGYKICSRFDKILKTMFQEISVQREQMYESIGRYLQKTNGDTTIRPYRKRRGLINIVGSAMKTLFGVCDNECANEATREIESIEKTNERMIHILKNQTTVVKSAITGISGASIEINKLYIELGEKQSTLRKKIGELVNVTHTLETLVLTDRIHSIFTALLTQYSYETTTISAIITAARTGVLHPSLLTPRDLAKHLTEIKLKLPINLNLPMGTDPSEIYELSKITKMAVFYSGNNIAFVIRIPLVTELELTLYKILPIPHPIELETIGIVDRRHSIIIKPEFQFLGITKNCKQYTTFTETQLLQCTETKLFTICPEFQPIQHESNKQPCEISLFKNPDTLPSSCETGIVVLTKNIFHKLKYQNVWIYTTNGETLTIACQGINEPYLVKIKRQGLIKLNQNCRAYGENIILNPTRDIKSKYYVNFIPQIGAGKLTFELPDKIKNLPDLKFTYDTNKLDNIHTMAKSLDEVENLIDDEILRQSGLKSDDNKYLKRSHKFVIMDFEFSMMNKTSMVLISGAISNSLDKCKVRKLEGRPLLLPLHEVLRQMKTHELLLAKKEIKRIFKCKEILQVHV